MGKKIKEYFKGKNPYLMASAAIVIVSMAVICLLIKDEMSAVQETGDRGPCSAFLGILFNS